MKPRTLRADLLLLLVALIWGLAFAAQRAGMEHMGPFAFNGARFALGSLALLPLLWRQRGQRPTERGDHRGRIMGSLLAALLLFLGSSFQQIGIVYTAAGKAGFITGLYVIIVPIIGLFLGQRAGWGTWLGAALAVAGLYSLSVTGKFTIRAGDLYVMFSALIWAFHVHVISRYSGRIDALRLAFVQYAVTALLSLLVAFFWEDIDIRAWGDALIPILYAGLLSVGVGYTLQVLAQKDAPPAHAAILLSLESVFAVVGGWLLLGEILSPRGILGCALMLAGMWVSQISWEKVCLQLFSGSADIDTIA